MRGRLDQLGSYTGRALETEATRPEPRAASSQSLGCRCSKSFIEFNHFFLKCFIDVVLRFAQETVSWRLILFDNRADLGQGTRASQEQKWATMPGAGQGRFPIKTSLRLVFEKRQMSLLSSSLWLTTS